MLHTVVIVALLPSKIKLCTVAPAFSPEFLLAFKLRTHVLFYELRWLNAGRHGSMERMCTT